MAQPGQLSGGPGTNQYTKRNAAQPRHVAASRDDLLTQATSSDTAPSQLCYEIWGGECTVPVSPPTWSHEQHPTLDHKLTADKYTCCSPGLLEQLSQDESPKVRTLVGDHPLCPAATLERLSQDGNNDVRFAVAGNPNRTPEIAERLSQEEDPSIRWTIAMWPACPAPILERLSTDENPTVRAAVAENKNSTLNVLTPMLYDKTPNVARTAANNPALPPATRAMWQLARGSNPPRPRSA